MFVYNDGGQKGAENRARDELFNDRQAAALASRSDQGLPREVGPLVYWAGGRQFACEFMASPDAKPPYTGRHLLSLKCDPDRILELRAEWPAALLSGYYSDGCTWISVDLDADLPESLVLDLCDMSYALVFAKLPKRAQREIVGE